MSLADDRVRDRESLAGLPSWLAADPDRAAIVGRLDRATPFLPTYSFDMGFEQLRYGYASAMMLLGFVACPAVGVIQYPAVRRRRLGPVDA